LLIEAAWIGVIQESMLVDRVGEERSGLGLLLIAVASKEIVRAALLHFTVFK
jgi:hypothetical protein